MLTEFALAMMINCRAALYIVSKLSMLLYGFVVSCSSYSYFRKVQGTQPTLHNCPRGQMYPFDVGAMVPSPLTKPETCIVVGLICPPQNWFSRVSFSPNVGCSQHARHREPRKACTPIMLAERLGEKPLPSQSRLTRIVSWQTRHMQCWQGAVLPSSRNA